MSSEWPEPGIYENVPFETYLKWPYISNSRLKLAKRSMAHFLQGTEDKEPSDALRFGTLAHTGKLEPLAVAARYAFMPDFTDQCRTKRGKVPDNPRATADWNRLEAEFERANPGKQIVPRADYERLVKLVESLSRNERARRYLEEPGKIEVSIVWDDPETGLRCKGRIDVLNSGIGDLKTCRDASRFASAISEFGYYRQGAMYIDGLQVLTGERKEFRLVAVEPTAPFGVRAAPLSDDAIAVGRDEYRGLLRSIAKCIETKCWPGYDDPESWTLASWHKVEEEEPLALTMGGKSVLI